MSSYPGQRLVWGVLGCLMLAVLSDSALAQTGPVGWWKLDEGSGTSTADASGNSHTGTLVNSPTWATGRVGPGALDFNTTNSYVTVGGGGNLTDLKTTGLTVSAWIYPRTAGGSNSGRIVDKDNENVGWMFRMASSQNIAFWGDAFATGAASRSSTAGSITFNTWQHVVATWTGSATGTTIHLYVNGVLVDGTAVDGTGTSSGTDASSPLTIGDVTVDLVRRFDGLIDDVRVYNRVLSASEITTLADSTVPSAPSGLGATVISSSQINLSWTAATDNVGVTGYLVERCAGSTCSNFVQVGTPSGTTFNDTGLAGSTTYRYRVRATDANSNLSAYSSIVNATTSTGGGDTTPPSVPTNLSVTSTSSTQVNLSWTASTDNVGVTGYEVYRCTGSTCTTFSPAGSPTGTTFTDSGLTASTTYRYEVRALDAVPNRSAFSSIVNATTAAGGDTTAPSAPTGLVVIAASSTEVDLAWGASTDNVGVTGYLIERCQGAGCNNFAQVGTSTPPTYNDTGPGGTGLTPGTSYSYRVRATDAANNLSAYSTVLTYTTPAASADCN